MPTDELQHFERAGTHAPIYVFTTPSTVTNGLSQPGDDPEPQMLRVFSTPRTQTFIGPRNPDPAARSDLGRIAAVPGPVQGRADLVPSRLRSGADAEGGRCNAPDPGHRHLQLPRVPAGAVRHLRTDATLTLPAGTHLLEGNVGGLVKVAAVSLSPSPGAPYAPTTTATRAVTVHNWGVEYRTVTVGPGSASYLIVRQNYNSGWTRSWPDGPCSLSGSTDGGRRGWCRRDRAASSRSPTDPIGSTSSVSWRRRRLHWCYWASLSSHSGG